MGAVNFMSMRELRSSTSQIKEMLTEDGKIIVTNNGKPMALMLKIDESTMEDTLLALRQAQMARAVSGMRLSAASSGADGMSMDEIDNEIAQSRSERAAREGSE